MGRINLATIRAPKPKTKKSNTGPPKQQVASPTDPLAFLGLPQGIRTEPALPQPPQAPAKQPPTPPTPTPQTEPQPPPISEKDHRKNIALANTYLSQFPDKLEKYQSRKPDKMKPDELVEFIDTLRFEITTTNNLQNYISSVAKPMLLLYEKVLTESAGLKVSGISAMADSPDFQETTKAVILKYFGNSIVTQTEPEMKLIWLIVSATFAAHYAAEAGTQAARNQITNSSPPPPPPQQYHQPQPHNNNPAPTPQQTFQILDFDAPREAPPLQPIGDQADYATIANILEQKVENQPEAQKNKTIEELNAKYSDL